MPTQGNYTNTSHLKADGISQTALKEDDKSTYELYSVGIAQSSRDGPSHSFDSRSVLSRRSCPIHFLPSHSFEPNMRSFIVAFTILPLLAVAQRGGGGRGGGGGFFNHGGGNAPNTFVTVATAAPAATAAPPANNGGGNTGGSGAVSAALIPPYGITPGIKANDGTANCVGDNGKAIP
jgi:hypothetical protein